MKRRHGAPLLIVLAAMIATPGTAWAAAIDGGGDHSGGDNCQKGCGAFDPVLENSPVNLVICTTKDACSFGGKP